MRVCFVGDSFVNGTGDDDCLGWVGRVCAAMRARGIDLTVYNLGIRRDTSADVATRWLDETSRRLPDDVQDGRLVFSFGVNDTTFEDGHLRVAPDQSVTNARAIISAARSRWPVLMIGPPPVVEAAQNGRIEALSTDFALVCQELDVAYLETFRPLLEAGGWQSEAFRGDGAHPNAAGYAALANLVDGWFAWRAHVQLSR